MNFYLLLIISIIIGYLFGSIPFALVIGKVFYKTDVRQHGSGNLGSTNVARTLGPVAGASVLVCDVIKSGLPALILFLIAKQVLEDPSLAGIIFCSTGIFVAIGHCYPIFANFKGGKAVATILGFLIFSNWKLALIGFVTWLIIVLITKIISLGSVITAIVTGAASFIPFVHSSYLFDASTGPIKYVYSITIVFLAVLLVLKHIPNIKRLLKHEEKQFHFGSRKKDV